MTILKADGAITSISMDQSNIEGMVGSSSGSLYYVNFEEKVIIRVISKASPFQAEISQLSINQQNPSLFLTNSSTDSSLVRLWTSSTVD